MKYFSPSIIYRLPSLCFNVFGLTLKISKRYRLWINFYFLYGYVN